MPPSTESRSKPPRSRSSAPIKTSGGARSKRGILEDPWVEPPPETFQWTTDPKLAPDLAEEVEISFDRGKPIAIGGRDLDAVDLIGELNQLAGKHGIGRIDHIENRLVGIKSREIYEAPAAVLLHEAHRELEFLTLSKSRCDSRRW